MAYNRAAVGREGKTDPRDQMRTRFFDYVYEKSVDSAVKPTAELCVSISALKSCPKHEGYKQQLGARAVIYNIIQIAICALGEELHSEDGIHKLKLILNDNFRQRGLKI